MGNFIDDCWCCDFNWECNRKWLVDCGIGFGRDVIGGKNGKVYVVMDFCDDFVNLFNGILCYVVI